MVEVFQSIGASLGAFGVIAGGAWALWRFFLFATLARVFRVNIERYEFSENDQHVVLVEASFVNESRTRTEVIDISFRAIVPFDQSAEARQIADVTTPWQRLGGQPGDTWNPGETQQAVFDVPWPDGRLAVPLHFRFTFIESIDRPGISPMIRRLVLLKGISGRERSITVHRLLIRP